MTTATSNFCRRHSSFFCPCAHPTLYRGEREKIESWGLTDEEVAQVLQQAERPVEDWTITDGLYGRPWPNLVPDVEMKAWARKKIAVDDANKMNQLDNHADAATRADGYLGEAVMHAWLEAHRVQHHWNGGRDNMADFIIEGVEVAFRTCATRSTLSKLNFIYIFEAQAHGPQQRFFGYINRETGRVWLVGGITLDDFLLKARRYEVGEELQPGFVCRHPMLVRSVASLTAPAVWLEGLR